jgi:membrane fusion protein (multidrug efflux system)
MAKRMIQVLATAALLLAILGFVKVRQSHSAAQASAFQPPPEAVTTIVARQEKWPATLAAIGTIAPVKGVTVSADLPGTVDRIAFESGKSVREGQVLVDLDTRQERAQLAAAEAQRDLARLNFRRTQELFNQGVISRMEYDRATADQRQTDAQVGEIRATIDRKTIRAPFSGVLGLRKVNLGQYLAAGNEIVPLQSLDPVYVNFGIPQQSAGQLRIGQNVRVATGDVAGVEFRGRVTAVDSVVDEATRNLQVQATVGNPDGKLHAGMFAQVDLMLGATRSVVALPASAINYAPYGDSVFIVSELKDQKGQPYRGLRQQFVKLEGARGDQVAVVSGINPGDEVVSSGGFKLRNGAAVQVNNKIQPSNSLAPRVEER